MATASSSTSITVTWTAPSMPNGVIRRYIVNYYRSRLGIFDSRQIDVTTGTRVVLSGLDIFTSYSIFVQAFTNVLGRADSNPVTQRTNEDGQSLNFKTVMAFNVCYYNIL